MKKAILAGLFAVSALAYTGQPAKADWLCGPDQCAWVTYTIVDEPAYALTWGPPARPSCFWKQGVFGRWKLVCP